MPLSNYLPKGLFEIKGDTMVERQIKQLHDAGIREIVLVVGYLKERYYEMAKKYPELIVIDNTEWEEKNNMSSLYAARDYLKASYVCCSDNWFAHNVYRDYVYDSYYGCLYSDEFCNEYCVKGLDDRGYMTEVKKGGAQFLRGGQDLFFPGFPFQQVRQLPYGFRAVAGKEYLAFQAGQYGERLNHAGT